jgi:methylmalonyl-CoA/ethylmalonyl-CoA epimerase
MSNSHLSFHHFGLAVRRPDEARKFVAVLGYQPGEPVFDPAQNVHLQLCTHASHPAVEIIWPGGAGGPVDKLAQRHTAGVIYHLCYETDNLSAALAGLEAAGLPAICISPPKPAPLFGGRPVSFYNVVGMGLVEILELI